MRLQCTFPNCNNTGHARGFCNTHYRQLHRSGITPLPQPSIPERFWPKVDRRSPDECWPWLGTHADRGYGRFGLSDPRRNVPAHRLAGELYYGETMSPELNALHSCDNPPCCNPHHIRPGTQAENMADAIARGRHR